MNQSSMAMGHVLVGFLPKAAELSPSDERILVLIGYLNQVNFNSSAIGSPDSALFETGTLIPISPAPQTCTYHQSNLEN
jgi:hypothetical protein